jgi:hypothetical protein
MVSCLRTPSVADPYDVNHEGDSPTGPDELSDDDNIADANLHETLSCYQDPPAPNQACYRRHLHQSRGRLGAWVSRGNRPQKETLGSVSMYPLVLLTSLVVVTVCRPLPPSPLFDDVPMTSTYVCVFWTLVFPPDDVLYE